MCQYVELCAHYTITTPKTSFNCEQVLSIHYLTQHTVPTHSILAIYCHCLLSFTFNPLREGNQKTEDDLMQLKSRQVNQ